MRCPRCGESMARIIKYPETWYCFNCAMRGATKSID